MRVNSRRFPQQGPSALRAFVRPLTRESRHCIVARNARVYARKHVARSLYLNICSSMRARSSARAHTARFLVRFYNRAAYRVYRVATIGARALSACVHLVYNCGAHRTHDLYKIDAIVCRLTRREPVRQRGSKKRERERERCRASVLRRGEPSPFAGIHPVATSTTIAVDELTFISNLASYRVASHRVASHREHENATGRRDSRRGRSVRARTLDTLQRMTRCLSRVAPARKGNASPRSAKRGLPRAPRGTRKAEREDGEETERIRQLRPSDSCGRKLLLCSHVLGYV